MTAVKDNRLASSLKTLHESVFDENSSTGDRDATVVHQAHDIYRCFPERDFANLSFSKSPKLRTSLGLLGRLQTASEVLTRAAKRLPNFSQISIHTIECPRGSRAGPTGGRAASGQPPDTWTVAQVFQLLGRPLIDSTVQDVMGSGSKRSKWTKNKLLQKFDALRSSTWETHAEMQLLPAYIEAKSRNDSVFDYIGCSKRSCFLCWHFLDHVAGIKTRGCHGKLYTLWNLPNFQGLPAAWERQVVDAMRKLESELKEKILNQDTTFFPSAKESTVGGSSIMTVVPHVERPSLLARVRDYLTNQLADMLITSSSE